MQKLRVLDLFSGIGGFSLGLERTGGFETVAFCEIEDYPRRVLAKHWPDVPIYADALRRDGITVDVICGGSPCQDLSFAGKRAGIEGARSGLWSEYARLIGEIRPRYVLVENVPGLLSLGMGTVLGGLSSLGYDATWDCVPASAIGAPHRRNRVWLVAYARGQQHEGNVADTACHGWQPRRAGHSAEVERGRQSDRGFSVSDVADADFQSLEVGKSIGIDAEAKFASVVGTDWWATEPDVGRVAHGVPSRVDRLRGLGNAVVPQVVETIGRAIMSAEASR